jgi:hypothetical protein
VANAVLAAAQLNTDIRDNLLYLKGLLDGTGADAVAFPTTAQFGLAGFFAGPSSGNPLLNFDSGDGFVYDRAANSLVLNIGGLAKLQVDANGKLTGAALWNSGRFAVAAGATVDTNHAWLANSLRPAIVFGYYAGGTQILDGNVQTPLGIGPASTEKLKITVVDTLKVRVVSSDTVSNTVVLYAILGPVTT